jgi:hypothetical protein
MTTTRPSITMNKKIGFLGTNQQLCGKFSNLMFFIFYEFFKPHMRCVVYHNIHQEKARQNNSRLHKDFITYNKDHGTITMTRHVFTKHITILSTYKTQRQLNTINIGLDA